jgi:hypothetical protein
VKALALASVALLLSGCASFSRLTTADPVPAKDVELTVALAAVAARDTQYEVGWIYPTFELGARLGLGHDMDAAVRLYGVGIDLSWKWRFARTTRWRFALAPSFAFAKTNDQSITTDASFTFVHAPILASVDLGEPTTLTFGAGLLYAGFFPYGGGTAHGLMFGASSSLLVDASSVVGFLFELDAYMSIAGEEPLHGPAAQLDIALVVRP